MTNKNLNGNTIGAIFWIFSVYNFCYFFFLLYEDVLGEGLNGKTLIRYFEIFKNYDNDNLENSNFIFELTTNPKLVKLYRRHGFRTYFTATRYHGFKKNLNRELFNKWDIIRKDTIFVFQIEYPNYVFNLNYITKLLSDYESKVNRLPARNYIRYLFNTERIKLYYI